MAKRQILYTVGVNTKTGEMELKRFTGKFDKGLDSNVKNLKRVAAATAAIFVAYKTAQKLFEHGLLDVKTFAAFEKGLLEVSTLSDEVKENLSGFKKEILDLSKETGQPFKLLNKALYDAVSAGVPAGEAIAFVGTSAKLAIGGVSAVTSTVDLLTGVMNAYHKEASYADTISDKFFATVKEGKTTIEEMAGAVPSIASSAYAAGLSIDEMLASVAQLTVVMGDTAESSVALNGLLKAIANPSKELAAIFKKYGYESGLAAIKTEGFVGVLKILQKETGGSLDKLFALVPETRAVKGAMILASEGAKGFSEKLYEIVHSAGATDKAVGIMVAGLDMKFLQLAATIEAAKINIGEEMAPAVSDALVTMTQNVIPELEKLGKAVMPGLTNAFATLIKQMADTATWWGDLFTDTPAEQFIEVTRRIFELKKGLADVSMQARLYGLTEEEMSLKIRKELSLLETDRKRFTAQITTNNEIERKEEAETANKKEEAEKKKAAAVAAAAAKIIAENEAKTEAERKLAQELELIYIKAVKGQYEYDLAMLNKTYAAHKKKYGKSKKLDEAYQASKLKLDKKYEKKQTDADRKREKLLKEFDKRTRKRELGAFAFEVDLLQKRADKLIEYGEDSEAVYDDLTALTEALDATYEETGVRYDSVLDQMLGVTEEKWAEMSDIQKDQALRAAEDIAGIYGALGNVMADALSSALTGDDFDYEAAAMEVGDAIGTLVGAAIGTYLGGSAGGEAGAVIGGIIGRAIADAMYEETEDGWTRMEEQIANWQKAMDSNDVEAWTGGWLRALQQLNANIGDVIFTSESLNEQWDDLMNQASATGDIIDEFGADSEEAATALDTLSESSLALASDILMSGEAANAYTQTLIDLAYATDSTANKVWAEMEAMSKLSTAIYETSDATRGLAQANEASALGFQMINEQADMTYEEYNKIWFAATRLAEIDKERIAIQKELTEGGLTEEEYETKRAQLAALNKEAKEYEDALTAGTYNTDEASEANDGNAKSLMSVGDAADYADDKMSDLDTSLSDMKDSSIDATEKVKDLWAAIDEMQDKTITLTFDSSTTGTGAAFGEDYVPRDGAPYILHRGESVLSALKGDAPLYRKLQTSGAWQDMKTGGGSPTPTPINLITGGNDGVSIGDIHIYAAPGMDASEIAEEVIDTIRERSAAGVKIIDPAGVGGALI